MKRRSNVPSGCGPRAYDSARAHPLQTSLGPLTGTPAVNLFGVAFDPRDATFIRSPRRAPLVVLRSTGGTASPLASCGSAAVSSGGDAFPPSCAEPLGPVVGGETSAVDCTCRGG